MDKLEYGWFKEQIKNLMGIDLNDYSTRQLDHRLTFIMKQADVKTYREYYCLLEDNPEKCRDFLKHLKINVSSFYRDRQKWDRLTEEVLPGLVARARDRRRKSIFGPGLPELRVWSAGCATGAEPYSMAIVLEETKGILGFTYMHILASDVVPEVLKKARTALFSDKDIKDIPQALKNKYLMREKDGWRVIGRARKHVKFIRHDLLKDSWSTRFDLILCRNVLIYMNDHVKQRLYTQFRENLRPGGVLFLGGSEMILQPEEYGYKKVTASFYERV